jgi:hypothetical protein
MFEGCLGDAGDLPPMGHRCTDPEALAEGAVGGIVGVMKGVKQQKYFVEAAGLRLPDQLADSGLERGGGGHGEHLAIRPAGGNAILTSRPAARRGHF